MNQPIENKTYDTLSVLIVEDEETSYVNQLKDNIINDCYITKVELVRDIPDFDDYLNKNVHQFPDVAIVDIQLKDQNDGGLRVIKKINNHWPFTRVLIYTNHPEFRLDAFTNCEIVHMESKAAQASLEILRIQMGKHIKHRDQDYQWALTSLKATAQENSGHGQLTIFADTNSIQWCGKTVTLAPQELRVLSFIANSVKSVKLDDYVAANCYMEMSYTQWTGIITNIRKKIAAKVKDQDPRFLIACKKASYGLINHNKKGYSWKNIV